MDGISLYDLVNNTERHVSEPKLTCCGVSFNFDGSLIAVGDFEGNVYIYSSNAENRTPLTQFAFVSFIIIKIYIIR